MANSEFFQTGTVNISALLRQLEKAGYRSAGRQTGRERMIYYDTQAGDLYREQLYLRWLEQAACWQLFRDETELARQPSNPGGGWTEGPVRDEYDRCTGGKPLVPVLSFHCRERRFQLLAPNRESIGLSELRLSVRSPLELRAARHVRLWQIVSSREGSTEVQNLAVWLRIGAGFKPVSGLLPAGLSVCGLPEPGAPVPSGLRALPGDSLEAAVRKVLAVQAYKIRANTGGAVADLDPEFVHDIRVATRRARFVLRLAGSSAMSGALAVMRDELRWLAELLGQVRDLDVLKQNMQRHMETGWPAELEPAGVLNLLETDRRRKIKTLIRALRSMRCRNLLASLDNMPEVPAVLPPPSLPDLRSLRQLAPQLIEPALQKVIAWKRKKKRESEDDALHRLRIQLKRLRYTMEFCRECEPDLLVPAIGELSRLQDLLGRVQDTRAARRHCLEWARQANEPRPDRLLVLGALIGRECRAGEKARRAFGRIWQDWPERLPSLGKLALWTKENQPPAPAKSKTADRPASAVNHPSTSNEMPSGEANPERPEDIGS